MSLLTLRTGGIVILEKVCVEGEHFNAEIHKVFPDNCVFYTLWQQVREDPYLGVKIQCPHTLGNIEIFRQYITVFCM